MCSISQKYNLLWFTFQVHILIIVRKNVFMLVAYGTVQAYDPLGLYLLMVALMGCFLVLSNGALFAV